jgi:hypothetical protein
MGAMAGVFFVMATPPVPLLRHFWHGQMAALVGAEVVGGIINVLSVRPQYDAVSGCDCDFQRLHAV